MKYDNIINSYIDDPVEDVSSLKGGHINRSFLVKGREDYVLQCLNAGLYSDYIKALENNYRQYRRACETVEEDILWFCPEWLECKEKGFFHRDDDGNIWRMYRYIPSEEISGSDGCIDVYVAGVGLGRLHGILKQCNDITDIRSNTCLYDLGFHYRRYRQQDGSRMKRVEEFDRIISESIEDMLGISPPAGRVIHGDAKVANMLFQDGEVAGFVDLDTIMHGSIYDDLADCIRSCCFDIDGKCNREEVTWFIAGYEEGAKETFTKDEIELLDRIIVRNRFMLGMRYYTDYLSDEGYFKDLDATQKLERARLILSRC